MKTAILHITFYEALLKYAYIPEVWQWVKYLEINGEIMKKVLTCGDESIVKSFLLHIKSKPIKELSYHLGSVELKVWTNNVNSIGVKIIHGKL